MFCEAYSLFLYLNFEAVVTARKRYGWVKFAPCGKIMYGKMFSLRLKGLHSRATEASNSVWK